MFSSGGGYICEYEKVRPSAFSFCRVVNVPAGPVSRPSGGEDGFAGECDCGVDAGTVSDGVLRGALAGGVCVPGFDVGVQFAEWGEVGVYGEAAAGARAGGELAVQHL